VDLQFSFFSFNFFSASIWASVSFGAASAGADDIARPKIKASEIAFNIFTRKPFAGKASRINGEP
jgi:hypothetical protein